METTLRERLEQIGAEYRAAVAQARKNAPPMDGVLGMGSQVKNDPCHLAFAQRMEEALAAPQSEAEAADGLRALWALSEAEQGDQVVYLMFLAVHQYALPLAKRLSPALAEPLAEEYRALYPRHKRVPAQQQLADALFAQAGKREKHRAFWRR